MPQTEHARAPHPLPIDESTATTRKSPPSLSKLPAADPRTLGSHSPSTPSTPRPLLSPTAESATPLNKPKEKDAGKSESAAKPLLEPEEESDNEASKNNDRPVIDMETFQQILELDEDGYDFSRGMAWEYFSQAGTTFEEMDNMYNEKDLEKLSHLGHFLKGSSAALGVWKVQETCEKIQHYGQLRDEEKDKHLTKDEALALIGRLLKQRILIRSNVLHLGLST
ncbi:signal transduction histidine kinase [Crucibulum laeve]|uniref:Signal transduction histidine kinase n=1 Tax=Crucibulum laeve TaxID=68775 RepID=A0A5C3M8C4_9AGAR|nr:signal transduction histidine kinase [Crucibulum laeve]